MMPLAPSTLASAAATMSGSGLLFSTSSEVVQASARDLPSMRSRKTSTCSVLPELASTSRKPRSLTSASSSCAPSNGWTSPISASNSSTHAWRRSSPCASSASGPATAATNWSPPIPMPRWMRHIGRVMS